MDKMRIMLVDDEGGFLLTTKRLLERKDMQVTTASSGHEALEKLAGESVHVVILDVKMPGMDGMAVLKAVKSRYPLVQVVMLTGHGTVDSAMEGLRSGATDYLMKPIDIDELIAKAEEAFVRWQIMEEKIRVAEGRATDKTQK
jgi:DNA-binding NtrC family response regulator